MSLQATARPILSPAAQESRGHSIRLHLGVLLGVALVAALIAYGFDYYALDSAQRPFSSKHVLLKPSGTIGLKLGLFGLLLFLGLYLYPIRKRWPWLARQGNARHWLDVHILLGLLAPMVIAFHAAFKFRGVAGLAFWIMTAVALSGLVGRYIYAQIPRSLSAAELSLKEVHTEEDAMEDTLHAQTLFSQAELKRMLHFPTADQVQKMSALSALGCMMGIDITRPFRIAVLRRRSLEGMEMLTTLGGLLSSDHEDLENVIRTARRKAALSKRVLFLSRTQQVFHMWHVVHRPFSYSFAVLAAIHILVVMLFGAL